MSEARHLGADARDVGELGGLGVGSQREEMLVRAYRACAVALGALARENSPFARHPPATASSARPAAPGARSAAQNPSLAVLPFSSVGSDTANTYFADGMTEALITALAQVPGLRVTPRTSAFALKGRVLSARQVGDTLHVASVLEGSVQRAGERLRFSVRLTDAASDVALWATTYEGARGDVFRLQDSIAHAVVGALQLRLPGGAVQPLVREATRSVAAHDLYLQGRYFWNQRTPAALRTAARYFERAVGTDSNYAEAHSGLAATYMLFALYDVTAPRDAYTKARAAAVRALRLDSTLAEPHAVLAYAAMNADWDWPIAEREYRRAIALDTAYATAHHWYALYLGARGRDAEALAEIDRALALEPLSRIIGGNRARILYWSRRDDDAIRQLRQTLDLDPDFAETHGLLGIVYLAKGMNAEAVAELEQAVRAGGRSYNSGALAAAYARNGQRDRALGVVRDLTERARRGYVPPIAFAIAYAGLGDRDRLFARLERAADDHDALILFLRMLAIIEPIRGDPDLLRCSRGCGLTTGASGQGLGVRERG